MHLEKQFVADRPHDEAVKIAAREDTLTGLFPDSKTEIIESDGNLRTARSHYTALGREGTATFHFVYEEDGNVGFEKVCDGNVWRELAGSLEFEPDGSRTRVRVGLTGRTKPLVPEFTIKGAMRDQLEEMASALRERIELG